MLHPVDERRENGYNILIAWLRGAAQTLRCIILYAPMMELVDMRDLGSRAFSVWVRVPSGAPKTSPRMIFYHSGARFILVRVICFSKNLLLKIIEIRRRKKLT